MKKRGFPPERRIRKSRDFQKFQAEGARFHAPMFTARFFHDSTHPSRLGIVASKKIGNAVQRNRVKRLLREFFRLADFFQEGWQIIIIAKPGSAELSLADVSAQLSPLSRRLERIVPEK